MPGKDGKPRRAPAAKPATEVASPAAHATAGPAAFRRKTAAAHKEHHESGRLWIVDGNFVRPVPVKIIATDGTMTEVRGQETSAKAWRS